MVAFEQRSSIKHALHALFTACILATAVVALITLNRQPNLQTPTNSIWLDRNVVGYTAEKDKTVLEQLQEKAEVEATISQSETSVQSINEVRGATGEQWQLYVDGHRLDENPLTYTTRGGESVEWRLE